MGRFNFVKRCFNCGSILQCERKDQDGYIDEPLFSKNEEVPLFCNKCWDQQRYNFSPKSPSVSKDYLSMLLDAQASDALIVYLVDLFSFESSFAPEVNSILDGLNIIVIGNKRDLLPSYINEDLLKEYVAHRFRVAKINVSSSDVILSSLSSSCNVEKIASLIEKRRKKHDVYIIGSVGAGKTLLLSSFLRSFKNKSLHPIQSKEYGKTNIKVMQIPLDSTSYMYDTPGISINNSLLSILSFDQIKNVYPDSKIKVRRTLLSKNESLFLGGLVKIELLGGEKTLVYLSFSPKLKIDKKAKKKNEKTDYFFAAIEKGVLEPTLNVYNGPSSFDCFDLEIKEEGLRDIGVEGLGFITFEGKNQTFRIYVPKGVALYQTRTKLVK
ncbi:MAG TPA: hypothetical protein DEF61_03925 [Firmicutes bacterium]|nr:hypothetical protein [Bacillota bacterium]